MLVRPPPIGRAGNATDDGIRGARADAFLGTCSAEFEIGRAGCTGCIGLGGGHTLVGRALKAHGSELIGDGGADAGAGRESGAGIGNDAWEAVGGLTGIVFGKMI